MKALYYIVIGILVILLLKIAISLTGIAFKFILFLLFAGIIGYIVVALVNHSKR